MGGLGGGGTGGGGMAGLMKGLMGGGKKKKTKPKDSRALNGEQYGLLIEKQNEMNAANYSNLKKEETVFLTQKNILMTEKVLNRDVAI